MRAGGAGNENPFAGLQTGAQFQSRDDGRDTGAAGRRHLQGKVIREVPTGSGRGRCLLREGAVVQHRDDPVAGAEILYAGADRAHDPRGVTPGNVGKRRLRADICLPSSEIGKVQACCSSTSMTYVPGFGQRVH